MAEVPEVQILVDDLNATVIGRQIIGAAVFQHDVVRFPTPMEFVEAIAGYTIEGAVRRGKYILLNLEREMCLALHMMLWGTLTLQPTRETYPRHTMVRIFLDSHEELQLRDTLGYARVAFGTSDAVERGLSLNELGPDALDPSFTVEVLQQRLARRKGALKTVLINPKVLTGMGNRDADESMWMAGIHPQRQPATLTNDDYQRLYTAMLSMLHEGLELRGTQPDLFGVMGKAKHRRNIFERTGQPCPRCGTPIEHVRLNSRNTHYCPTCQH